MIFFEHLKLMLIYRFLFNQYTVVKVANHNFLAMFQYMPYFKNMIFVRHFDREFFSKFSNQIYYTQYFSSVPVLHYL